MFFMEFNRYKPNMLLKNDIFEQYQQYRWIPPVNKDIVCYAPFVSINFDQTGEMTTCCFNRNLVLGEYPKRTIKEAWLSEEIQYLRTSLQKKDFGCGCRFCYEALQAKNFSGALMNYYDMFYTPIEKSTMPKCFVFEISNTCNLECIMCGGKWSSAIRKNREQLPAIKHPYDAGFVEQLKEFLPHLKTMKLPWWRTFFDTTLLRYLGSSYQYKSQY